MTSKFIYTLLISICTLFFQSAYGQVSNYYFQNYTEKNGFNASEINCMIQDKKGYIWFGTEHGIYKYDGYKLERFTSKYGIENSLSCNHIYGLAEDKTGKIWISTKVDGLNCYDPAKRRFTTFKHRDKDSTSLVTDRLMRLYVDSRNKLWIGNVDKGWSVKDLNNGSIRHFNVKSKYIGVYGNDAANTPDPFLEDRNGGMWITSGFGLHFQDTNNKIYSYYDTSSRKRTQNDNLFLCIYQSDDTTLWLGTWGTGLKKFNTRTKVFTQFVYKNVNVFAFFQNIITDITSKSENELWVTTLDQGLAIFNIETGKFDFLSHDPENPGSPLKGGSGRMIKDRSGTLWISYYTGISKLVDKSGAFTSIKVKDVSDEYKQSNFPVAFYKDTATGLVYVGLISGKGLYIFDEKNGTEQVVKIPDNKKNKSKFHQVNIHSILALNENVLLLATNYGICTFEIKTREIKLLQIKDQEMKHAFGSELIRGHNGIWCNSTPNNGFYFIPSNLTTAIHYYNGKASPLPFHTNRIEMVLDEADSLVWVTNIDSGLFKMNPKKNTITPINNTLNKELYGGSMVKQGNGFYWLASEQFGIFNIKQGADASYTIRQYSEEDGLTSDFTNNVILDHRGNVLVATQKGPSVLLKNQTRFLNFKNNNFLADNTGEFSKLYQSPDGYIYIGKMGEYIKWHQDSFSASTSQPRLYLTSLRVFEKEFNDTLDLDTLRNLNLDYTKNSISVSFVALDLSAPEAIRYAYKMDGIDTGWIDCNNERTLSFSRLLPGNYVLHVKATNGMGVPAQNEIALGIIISPPFWERWWFIALCCAGIIGMAAAAVIYRISVVRKEEKIKSDFAKTMAEVEMKALRAQMNPHFLFNCLNSIHRYIVVNDTLNASDYLTKFSKLIRLILEGSASDTTTLENEIKQLSLYIEMEAMRFDDQFTYSIVVDNKLAIETIVLPSMIIQPYIENAIWHGLLNKVTGGHLSIIFNDIGNAVLEVMISDDGIGRQKAAELKSKSALKHKSYGMQITNDRIKALNQMYNTGAEVTIEDLKDKDGNGCGTKVCLRIPYKNVKHN